MFAIALMMITVEKKPADIKMNAQFVITLNWTGVDDIDTWLRSPTGDIVYFRRLAAPMMHLDRDDLGDDGDVLHLASGEVIRYEYNQEITTIRGFIPGEWVLNIHMYKRKQSAPAEVMVTMQRLNPVAETVFIRKYKIKRNWREITVARFTMDAEGNITNQDDLYEKLIRDSKNVGKKIDTHKNDNQRNWDVSDEHIDVPGVP